MGKGGARCLDVGPKMGASRMEALGKLLAAVERESGRMMVRDARRADGERERERERDGRDGGR